MIRDCWCAQGAQETCTVATVASEVVLCECNWPGNIWAEWPSACMVGTSKVHTCTKNICGSCI